MVSNYINHRFSRGDTHINSNRAAAFRISKFYNVLYAFAIALYAKNLMVYDVSKHDDQMFKFLRGGWPFSFNDFRKLKIIENMT
jgi:hypothetical protein